MHEAALVPFASNTEGFQQSADGRVSGRVTGRGYMDVNRISGYIPGKMVFYLMQACPAAGTYCACSASFC